MRLPDAQGTCELLLGDNTPNILLWTGMAPELVQALSELLRDQLDLLFIRPPFWSIWSTAQCFVCRSPRA
jgi:hypothetical protein